MSPCTLPSGHRIENEDEDEIHKGRNSLKSSRIEALNTPIEEEEEEEFHGDDHPGNSRTARPTALRLGTRISSYSRDTTIPAAPASNALRVA